MISSRFFSEAPPSLLDAKIRTSLGSLLATTRTQSDFQYRWRPGYKIHYRQLQIPEAIWTPTSLARH